MKSKLSAIAAFVLCMTMVQAGVPEDQGAMGLAQALNRLDVVSSVLHTGAHPDDENSSLVAWLSRGQGARTAYLAINRGEGGQNLLGSELFEALGVIRTEELLAARRFDRAGQFFTPNMDFGFSKTADESFEKWGREKVLGDFVRVIRQFRPEIVISRFTGTTSDGHGHHQVAGIVSQEAFRAAADPNRFPEYGKPWTVKKLYINGMGGGPGGGGAPAANAGLSINVGQYDAALGRSYSEIAAEGRSLHRSQAQGAARTKGPSPTNLRLAQKADGVQDTGALFSGVLHKLPDLAQLDPSLATDLAELERLIEDIRSKTLLARPATGVPDLVKALGQIRTIRQKTGHEHVQFLLDRKIPDFEEAVRLAAGVVIEVLANDEVVTRGQQFNLTISVVNGSASEIPVLVTPLLPDRWTSTERAANQPQAIRSSFVGAGQKVDRTFQVQVPENAAFTQPYWLRQPRTGDRFVSPDSAAATMPFDPPAISARVELAVNGTAIAITQPAEFRRVDSVLGELRSSVKVATALSVRLTPEIAVIPLEGDRRKTFTVTVENQNTTATDARVRLDAPANWVITPPEATLGFARQGDKKSITFTAAIPATAGNFNIRAVVTAGNKEYGTGYTTVAYPHIETHYLYAPAESKVEVFDLRSRVTSVGYVDGAGDRVAEALEQIGIKVTHLSDDDLASGDLSRFPTIVLGIRAYSTRDILATANARLLDYVNRGGTLIVQYNRSNEVPNIQLGPYPLTMTSNNNFRVTREDAPVRILDPAHPAFAAPNRITEKDFDGWVQERGTYFLSQWDSRYTPLLSSNDPGDQPLLGGLVTAKYGKGTYVYTGYVFFRELPAGVPGAYRLFANLVSIQN